MDALISANLTTPNIVPCFQITTGLIFDPISQLIVTSEPRSTRYPSGEFFFSLDGFVSKEMDDDRNVACKI